jgi:hypothetical protein
MSGGFTCHETKSVKEYLTDLKDFVEKRLDKDVKLAIPQVYNTQVKIITDLTDVKLAKVYSTVHT